jgi:NADP-dependent 3-hydroxy acid dehydrogenase YdfG
MLEIKTEYLKPLIAYQKFSTIDILINNAGNAHGLDPIQTGDVDDWDAMIDINVKGLLYVSKAIIPQMIERNLVTSSILALLLQRSLSKWKCILRLKTRCRCAKSRNAH